MCFIVILLRKKVLKEENELFIEDGKKNYF